MGLIGLIGLIYSADDGGLKGLDFGVEVAAVPIVGVGVGDAGHYVAG